MDIRQIMLQWIYNFDFLTDFSTKITENPNITIKQFYTEWSKKCKFSKNDNYYPLQNTLGFYLSGFYILIACYKEAEYDNLPKWNISDMNKDEWGNFIIVRCDEKNPDFQFLIRKIRNSLNHYRFELTVENSENFLIFIDGLNKKNIDFEVKFHVNDLNKFLFKFARTFIYNEHLQ